MLSKDNKKEPSIEFMPPIAFLSLARELECVLKTEIEE